jgi:hypothetical protein
VYYEEQKLWQELELLRREHDDLDIILSDPSSIDQIAAQRLKKRKLWLKDRVSFIESILYPDIIA